jgi:hypothetical protein
MRYEVGCDAMGPHLHGDEGRDQRMSGVDRRAQPGDGGVEGGDVGGEGHAKRDELVTSLHHRHEACERAVQLVDKLERRARLLARRIKWDVSTGADVQAGVRSPVARRHRCDERGRA